MNLLETTPRLKQQGHRAAVGFWLIYLWLPWPLVPFLREAITASHVKGTFLSDKWRWLQLENSCPTFGHKLQVCCLKVTACSSQTQLDMSSGCSGHNRDLTWNLNPHLIFSITIFILYPKTAISFCSALWPQIWFSFSLSEKGQSTKFKGAWITYLCLFKYYTGSRHSSWAFPSRSQSWPGLLLTYLVLEISF